MKSGKSEVEGTLNMKDNQNIMQKKSASNV